MHLDAGTNGDCQVIGTGGGERRCSPKAEVEVLYPRVPNAVFLLCFCSQDTLRLCGKVAVAVTQHPALVPWSPAPAPSPACSSGCVPDRLSQDRCSGGVTALPRAFPGSAAPSRTLSFCQCPRVLPGISALLCFGVGAHPPHPLQ